MRSPLPRAGSAAISVLALLLLGLALLAPVGTADARGAVAHRWVVYSGQRRGLRIEFEVSGHRLTPAIVSIPIAGRVTPNRIEGTIALSFAERARVGNEEGHSGKHPHGPMEVLCFRANRRRSG
jgi:hypothetical protein